MTDEEIYAEFQGKKLFYSNFLNTKSYPTPDGLRLLKILKSQGGNDSKGRSWSDYFGFPQTISYENISEDQPYYNNPVTNKT